MSSWQIVHSCGHERFVRLSGSRASQAWYADKQASRPCRDCWISARHAASRAEGEAALTKLDATPRPLAALEGSAKQIQWAEQIRAKALVGLDGHRQDLEHVATVAQSALARITTAAWFCDRGRATPYTVAAAAVGWWLAEDTTTCLSLLTTEVAGAVAAEALCRHEAGDPYDVAYYGPWELARAALAGWKQWHSTRNPLREKDLPAAVLFQAILAAWPELRAEVLRELARNGLDDLPVSEALSDRFTRRTFGEAYDGART